MKGEVRAFRPTLASFQGGRGGARDSRLLERIQERNGARQTTLVLQRTREEKPLLARRQVEAVSFEGTGVHSRRTGPLATAVAAGLLAIIAPNLGNAEPTRAAATVQIETEDNPFGFKKGKTSVREIGKLLGARGVGEMEWIVEERGRVTTLLVADGVKAVYLFITGVYSGRITDLAGEDFLDLSRARNWALASPKSGVTFVTAENFLAKVGERFQSAIYMFGANADTKALVSRSLSIAPIISIEGSLRNPRLTVDSKGLIVMLYAEREDGTPWQNVYAFDGETGKYLGARKADKPFLQSVGLAMLTP